MSTVTSITAVKIQRAIDEQQLKSIDEKISDTERALVYLLHHRRELVNRLGINKNNGDPL